MKVELIFDSQFCGKISHIKEVPDNATPTYIKSLFETYIGVPFNDGCHWTVVPDGGRQMTINDWIRDATLRGGKKNEQEVHH